MKNRYFDIFCDAICSIHSDVTDIREPRISGTQHNVLFAQTAQGGRVFKFGCPEIVQKNAIVSQIYDYRGIPCPKITAREYHGLHFEEYQIIPGRTLFEAMGAGIGGEQIRTIYRKILQAFAKMERVYPVFLNHAPINHIHYVARENIANVNSPLLGNIFMGLVYMLNIGRRKNMAIFHSDITPKNVIVSDDGDFLGFIDMDSVCVCNRHFAFGAMAAKYQLMGFDIKELFNYYERYTSNDLNRARITTMANLNNFGKKLLWKHAQHKR